MSDTLTALADFIASYKGLSGSKAVTSFRDDLFATSEEAVVPSWQDFRMGGSAPAVDLDKTRTVVRGVQSPIGNLRATNWIDKTPRTEGVRWTHLEANGTAVAGLESRLDENGDVLEASIVAETMEWVTRRSWEKALWAPQHPVGLPDSIPVADGDKDVEGRLARAIADYSVADVTTLFTVRPEEVLELDGLEIHFRKRFTDPEKNVITFLLYCDQDHYRLDLENVEGNVDGGLYHVTDTAVLYRATPLSETLMEFTATGETLRLA